MKHTALTAVKRLAISAAVLLAGAGAAGAQEPIRLGLAMPLSGQNGEYIKRYVLAGHEFAIKEQNEKGGILGRPIKLFIEDSRNDGASAVSALNKLINVDKVVAVFSIFTPVVLPMLPIAEEKKVIVLAPSVEHPDLTKSRWAVRMTPTATTNGLLIAQQAHKMGLKTAATFAEDNEAIRVSVKAFVAEFEKLGGKMVGDETFKNQDTDMRGQLTKLKAARPDALYFLAPSGRPVALALKQISEVGFKPKQIFTTHLVEDREVMALGASMAEGVIYTAVATTPEFNQKFKAAYGYDSDVNAGKHYDSTMVLLQAIQKVGSEKDMTKVRDAIYNFGEYKGTIGTFRFVGSGESLVSPILKIVKNGKYVRYQP